MVPPFPEEIRLAEQFIEKAGGEPQNLSFWLFSTSTGELTNLSEILRGIDGEDAYRELIRSSALNLPDEADADHFRAARALVEHVKEDGRILMLPFQTRQAHHDEFRVEIEKGEVGLMSVSDRFVDKHEAAHTLLEVDRSLETVLLDPVQVLPNNSASTIEERIVDTASRIIQKAQEIEARSGAVYIKLDGAGVSGIDNLSPAKYQAIYSGTTSERVAALCEHMLKRFGTAAELPSAVIEKRVERRLDQFGVREYVASGVTTGNGFRPWCYVRAINDEQDAFQGVIGSTSPGQIGISSEDLSKIKNAMHRVVTAMNTAGYEFGYVAKDLMYDGSSNSMKINDHNDRRGGRSFVERILVMHPGEVIMDKDYEFKVPKGTAAIDYAMGLASAAAEKGHFVYGTCMNFYPTRKGEHEFVKLKIASRVPSNILETGALIIPTMEAVVRQEIEQACHVYHSN
jgi:hypothetical protein